MALITGSDVLNTPFTPAAGPFIVCVTGGEAALFRRDLASGAWGLVGGRNPILGSMDVNNPVAGAQYQFVGVTSSTTPTVRADQ